MSGPRRAFRLRVWAAPFEERVWALHHDRVARLVDPTSRLQAAREERTSTELRYGELDVAGGGGQQTQTGAIALVGAGLGAFMRAIADLLGRFDLDQLLQDEPHGLADQIHAVTGAERIQQFGHDRPCQGHR